MNSPAEKQQEKNLSDMIADQFDEMDTDEDIEETVSNEAEDIEDIDNVDNVDDDDEDIDNQLKEEIQEASDSDYSEPAPERWSAELKETYNSLPPQARKAMLEGVYKPMQRSYTQSTQELAAMRNQVKPLMEAFEPYRNDFERMGVNPVDAIRTQIAWAAHMSRVGTEQGLRDMQEAYGIKGQNANGGQVEEYLTPTERAFKQEIAQLKEQINGTKNSISEYDQQQQSRRNVEEIKHSLQQFINEKTEDGKPMHPHMTKVASKIGGIIRGGLVERVDEYGQPRSIRDQIAQAYNMACNLDPSIRTPSVNTRQANRVKAAQKVGVVTKLPVSQSSDSDELDISSFIEKTYDRLDRR